MKIVVIALLLLMTSILSADTIDYWHVYYNDTQIGGYVDYSNPREIVFDDDTIQKDDRLIIRYYNDTPCDKCPSNIYVVEANERIVIHSRGLGTSNPITYSLDELVQYSRKNGMRTFEVLYYEEHGGEPYKTPLFTIRII